MALLGAALPGVAFAEAAGPGAGRCDMSLASAIGADPLTRIVLVRKFTKGERLVLPADKAPQAAAAANDLCMVKLLVGPGNPGPAGAPSTSAGIGIEIWLPMLDHWNGRIHALAGGGFHGGVASKPDQVASPYAAAVADGEGAVSSTTDTGHDSVPKNYGIPDGSGDFAMNPNGSINEALWHDFSERAIHEQAVKTKLVTTAFYGRPATRSYWEGSSTGGRQGHKLAQAHPDDFDGIIANLPAMNWAEWTTGAVYAHVVFQRDLGGKVPTLAQQDLVSMAAIKACDMVGGEHLGYILDPSKCRYDPSRDRAVLCQSDGGTNGTADCLRRQQAIAFNKIWYGITSDGSVPDPARDNGWTTPPRGKHLWYGLSRGNSLYNAFFMKFLGRATGYASPECPPELGTDQLALEMQDPSLAQRGFKNAKTALRDGWKGLTYAKLADAFRRGVALDEKFGRISTANPDLSAFKARGGKLIVWHGTNDEVIPVQGTMQYYDRVVKRMGGLDKVQDFYRFYVVPGAGHQSPNGTANPNASPPIFGGSQPYEMLVDWVERGIAPENVTLRQPFAGANGRTFPACAYPAKASYKGGDPKIAASYRCEMPTK
ncbi:MAG: tannase/feruloyl esterase family alpha/beta hydrolase [Novosphingobium sp.]